MIDLEVRPCPGAVRGWGVVAHVSDGPWPPRHLPGRAGARHHRGVDGPPLRAEVALHSPVRRGLRPPPLASWASYIPRPLTPLSRLLYPLSPVLPLHTTPPVPLILLSHATYPISHLCPLTNIPRLIPHIPHPFFPFPPVPCPLSHLYRFTSPFLAGVGGSYDCTPIRIQFGAMAQHMRGSSRYSRRSAYPPSPIAREPLRADGRREKVGSLRSRGPLGALLGRPLEAILPSWILDI